MATSRIADSVGRVLGDRYRLIRPLGVGASAHVFVAEDVNLRRRVAIKLLHPGLAGDEAFLRRFRAEAQAVASLRHPNILTVYDWGQDDGSPYLVTELLEGGSLRSMLDQGVLLSPAQAAAVGADAARALDYAHRRGIVHRDIKPANLIFDDEGRVRVADFGLARALAEATWTEPEGAVVGTARYAAPEQARGERLDSRADVYSLALVLVEATTGTVPFASDTTLGTLMARIERPLEAPPGTGALAPVLDSAGTVDPASRLDAGSFARRLDGVSATLPPPKPLALARPIDSGGVEDGSSDPTDFPGRPTLFDAETVGGSEPPAVAAPGDTDPDASERREAPDEPGAIEPGAIEPGADEPGSDEPEDAESPRRAVVLPAPPGPSPRRRRRRRTLAVLAGALVLLGGAAAGYALTQGTFSTPSHPVPYVVGLPTQSAQSQLEALKLAMTVSSSTYEAHAAKGTVVSQNPSGGRLREGSDVAVVVSLGPQPVDVPPLAGQPATAAAQVLKDLGLAVGRRTFGNSMTVSTGLVISSSPDQGTLLPGQAVDLYISKGKPVVPVPVVAAGSNYSDYASALGRVGLGAAETESYDNAVARGLVIGTTPPQGTEVVVGTTVDVEVSKGPHLVAVPNVATQSVGAATQALSADGFQVTGVVGNPLGTVTGTRPGSGTLALYGSSIVIVTG